MKYTIRLFRAIPAALTCMLMLATSAMAQDKMLSSKQLMDRSLYPQRDVSSLQYAGNGNKIAYVKDTLLYMGAAGKAQPVLTLSVLNKALVASAKSRTAMPARNLSPTTIQVLLSATAPFQHQEAHRARLMTRRTRRRHRVEETTVSLPIPSTKPLRKNARSRHRRPNPDILRHRHRNEFGYQAHSVAARHYLAFPMDKSW